MLLKSVLIVFLIILSGCNYKEKTTKNAEIDMNILTESEWSILAGKRIFFGHQSVGADIVDGINDLKNENNSNEFIVIESKNKSDYLRPVFAHAFIGKNTDPKSKMDDFIAVLQNNLADTIDIAFMKLCYIDIDRHTDIADLFNYYQTSIKTLQERYPDLKILHCTVPLTITSGGLKGLAKVILGRDNNVYRDRFNQLIRGHYPKNEIFDIADLESRYPDGSVNESVYGIPCLITDYTSDGRHLNQKGRVFIAGELLKTLVKNGDQ